MRRLWIAAALLAAVTGLFLWNAWHLKGSLGQLSSLLDHAQVLAEEGDWTGAEGLAQEAFRRWEAREGYFYTVLRHSDVDQVRTGFREVLGHLRRREAGACAAATLRLTAELELLWEMEQLTLQNLL